MDFTKFGIKRPQMIGIIAGCIVFSLTVLTVIALLFKSGTMQGFLDQMKREAEQSKKGEKDEQDDGAYDMEDTPELYDELIEASKTLPRQPCIPNCLQVGTVRCRPLDMEGDSENVSKFCDGSAKFHASAYDARSIWKHLSFGHVEGIDQGKVGGVDTFRRCYGAELRDGVHVVIEDKDLAEPIGMLSLVDNDPRNLSIRIDNLWITPAYRSSCLVTAGASLDVALSKVVSDNRPRVAREALCAMLQWLFEDCYYRRVTVQVDPRHKVMCKLLAGAGFLLEATLRKHRIVRNRNRDTAVYVMLNSDWTLGARAALESNIGLRPTKKEKKGK